MNAISRLSTITLFAFFILPFFANGQCRWQTVPSNTSFDLRALHFPTPQQGWAVGTNGTIVRSTDGGLTWSSQTIPALRAMLNSVHFANTNVGWVVGTRGNIWKTTNGGATWAAQTSGTVLDLYDVWFADQNQGWAVGACGLILRTTNGGSQWVVQSSAPFTGSIFQVKVPNGTEGVATTSSTSLLSTANSGSNWPISTTVARSFRAFDMAPSGVAFAAAGNGPVLKTSNAGGTWANVNTPTGGGAWQSLSLVGENNVYLAGLNGAAVRSTDGGTTWGAFNAGLNNVDIYGLQMWGDTLGWAVGEGGKIFLYKSPAAPSISGPTAYCGTPITLTASGTYTTWRWSNNQTTPSISVSAAGTYTVTATAANGCTSTAVQVVGMGAVPDATVTALGSLTFCAGDSVVLQAPTGNGYSFQWRRNGTDINGAANASFTVKTAGNYTVLVSQNGCSNLSTIVSVAIASPQATVATANPTTFCANNSALLNATPGVGYTYQWQKDGSDIPNETNADYRATTTGAYRVIVSQSNCRDTSNVLTITAIPLPTATATAVGTPTTVCTGSSVTLNATTGVNYTYQWQRNGANILGATNPTFSANTTGDYTVVVTENGCSATSTAVAITIQPLPAAAIDTPKGKVLDCKTASVALDASGGTQYNWAGPITGSTASLSATLPGTYTVTVRDANGCSATATVVVSQDKTQPAIAAVGGALSCAQPSVQLNASSITPGVNFQWAGPNGFSSMLQNPTVTVTGTYTATATAPNGCTSTAMATVGGSSQLPTANATATGNTTICTGNSVTLNATTGTNYNYQWQRDGANIPGATNSTFSANVAGNYSVVVTENGCSATSTAVVVNVLALPAAAITPQQGGTLDCKTASVVLNASSGTQYDWKGPGGFMAVTANISVTVAGTYTVTVTDANNCSATATVVVSQDKTQPAIAAVGGVLSCAQPSVQLNASSITPGVNFQWAGPNGFSSMLPNPTVTVTGTYTATATAPNGCTSTAMATVGGSSQLPTAAITNTSPISICTGNSTTLNATTGTNYNYQWQRDGSNIAGATNPTFSANIAGNYSIVVTENGCSATSTAVAVTIQPSPAAAITPQQGGTLDCKTASVVLKASGGTQYNWAGPSTSSTDNLSATIAGTYTVTVTDDANGCSATATVVVSEDKNKPAVSAVGGVLSCAQPSVQLNASSITPGVNFQWAGPNGFSSNIPNPTVAVAGIYTATATAPNGCTNTATATVAGSSQLPTANATATGNTTICTGNSVTLNATTGTNYNYQWQRDGSNIAGATNPIFTANVAGNYSVVVTENGCSATSTAVVVNVFALPAAAITPQQGGTLDCKTASVVLNASGGTQYDWKGPGGFMAATANISVTIADTYTVVVTNANGCSATASAMVTEDKTKPAIAAVGGALSCAQPSVQLTASSTTPGVTFQWAGPNGFSSNIPNPMVAVAGTYTATATAPNGCTTQQTVSVADNRQTPNIGTANSALACNPGATTPLSGTSQTAGAQFSWTGPNGFTSSLANPIVGDTGTYVLTVRGPNGCTATATAQVRYNPGPTVAISAQSATCEAANGTVTLQVPNGNALSFAWNNGASAQNLSNVPAGTYTATVTGQDGCKSIGTATVSTTLKPVLGISPTAATKCTPPDGSVTLNVSSVTDTPQYLWNTGQTTDSLSNVGAGTYTATVTASNGCSATATTVVTGPNAPSANITTPLGLETTCRQAILPLQVDAVAGLSYNWNGPNGFTATTPQINVGTAGSYAVTVTNPASSCTAVSGTVVTANTTPPTVSAKPDTLNCKTASVVLQATTNTPNATYIWTGPNNFSSPLPNPTVSVAGTYTVVVGDPQNGCAASTTATVSENKTPPSAAIGTTQNSTQLTCSQTSLILNAPTGANFAYNWSGTLGSNNPVTVATTGTYSLTVTNNANGCSATSSIQITADQTPPTPTVTAPNGTVLTCRLTPLPLNASGGDAYRWAGPSNFAATGPNPSVTRAGTYMVTVTRNSNGCTASATITITANQTPPLPNVSTPNGITLNCLQTTVYLVAGDSNLYQWTGPTGIVTTDTFTVSTPGTYTVTVMANSNGCTTSASLSISRDIKPPDLDVQNCTLDCRTQSCQLQGMSMVSGASFLWAGPNGFTGNGQTVIVTSKGNYTVIVTNPVNGCTAARTATVSEKTVNVAIAGSSRFCKGSSTTLSANGTFKSYLWTPGNLTTPSIEVNRAGVYVLEVTDAEDCKGSTYLSVAQYPKPSVRLIAHDPSGAVRNDDNVCAGDSVILVAHGDQETTLRYQFFLNGQAVSSLSAQDVYRAANWRDGDQISAILEDPNGCRDTTLAGEATPFAPVTLRVYPKPDWTGALLSLERNCPGDSVLLRLSCPNFPNGVYTMDYILSTNNAPGATQVPFQVTNGNATLNLGILSLVGNTTCKITAVYNDRGCETNPTARNSITFYNGVPVQSLEKTICLGETYNFYGRILQQAGRYTQLFKTYDKKCDSLTVELMLNVTEGPSRDVYAKFCPGTVFRLGDATFTKAGNYTVYKNAPIGCDSVLNLVLNDIIPTEKNTQATICKGESYPFNGQVFTQTGRYIQTIQTFNKKCDSLILSLDLTVLPAPSRNISATLCQGGRFILGDSVFNQPGKYTVFKKRTNGCDSVLNLTLIAAAAQINLGKDTTLCLPATLILNPSPQCANCTYAWTPALLGNIPSPTVSPTVTTTYTVTVRDAQGCTATDAIRLQPLSAADTSVLLAKTDRVTLGKDETAIEIEVLANDNYPTNFKLSLVSPKEWKGNAEFDGEVLQYTAPSTSFLGTDTVRYRLCPPAGSACADACSEGLVLITVQNGVINTQTSDIPNVITPDNKDGLNDLFDPHAILKSKGNNLPVEDCTLSIINKWGELIFLSRNPYRPWKGTRGDNEDVFVPQGTYYYMFQFKDTPPLRGAIQVLR